MGTWNDYQWPLIMLRSPDMYTVIVAIASFPAPWFRQPWGVIMAGSALIDSWLPSREQMRGLHAGTRGDK
jgi:ABC-type glycerol-3-phosphate transport system permease component